MAEEPISIPTTLSPCLWEKRPAKNSVIAFAIYDKIILNMETIRYLIRSFLDFLFPKSKLVKKLEAMESEKVVALLKESQEKIEEPPGSVLSLFPYSNPNVHDLVHEIKYSANKNLAAKIAPALYEKCKEITFGYPALLTFIPVTRSRKIKRGFDQGVILLGAIKTHDEVLNTGKDKLQFSYNRDLLLWNRMTVQQSLTKDKEERMKNVQFALSCFDPLVVRNRTIIVIDDVCTTGATLLEAKRALLEAGAAKVHLLTIAH
jgi:ComF family protein